MEAVYGERPVDHAAEIAEHHIAAETRPAPIGRHP
jgi:hypothetical protein